MSKKILGGIRAIEYVNGLESSYCGKLLAGMGAEVIKIEEPGRGDSERYRGPYVGGETSPQKSIPFIYTNIGKKSVELDPRECGGLEQLKKMLSSCDVFIYYKDNNDPKRPDFTCDELRALNPNIIYLRLTAYGDAGPYKDYKNYSLNIAHMSGMTITYPLGSQDLTRPPVTLGGRFDEYDTGAMAAVGVLGALIYRKRTGEAQQVSLSGLEARFQLSNTENILYGVYQAVVERRAINRRQNASIIYECKDGYLCPFFTQQGELNRLAEMVGRSEWLEKDSWYQQKTERVKRIDEVIDAVAAWAAVRTKDEVRQEARKYKVPITPVMTPAESADMEQFAVRGFFQEVDQPGCGRVRMPARPFIMEKTPFDYSVPAPLLGEHNDELLGQIKE